MVSLTPWLACNEPRSGLRLAEIKHDSDLSTNADSKSQDAVTNAEDAVSPPVSQTKGKKDSPEPFVGATDFAYA